MINHLDFSKIAVVCAQGMGDGLIMHIASHNLTQAGTAVTTFSDHLEGFKKWVPGFQFAKQPHPEKIEKIFLDYDAVILQHDNSSKSFTIKNLKIPVFGFYGSHNLLKHGPLSDLDYVCNPTQCMNENIVKAMTKWFGLSSKENGLTPIQGLVHRKYHRRIAIHSGSSSPDRNWPIQKFKNVAAHFKKRGYDPVFLPELPSLEDLASFIYESGYFLGNDSGPGHLASCLKIPSLIIGKDYKHLLLWRPGWLPPHVETPPRLSSIFKWTKTHWKYFITSNKVIKQLKTKVLHN